MNIFLFSCPYENKLFEISCPGLTYEISIVSRIRAFALRCIAPSIDRSFELILFIDLSTRRSLDLPLPDIAAGVDRILQQVVERLREWGASLVEENEGRAELIAFPIPKSLRAS